MNTLLISCMDRRLNSIIDKQNNQSTIILRNAGANVEGLSNSITSMLNAHNISKIILMPHTDCGAMKVVYGAIKNGIKPSNEIYDRLVKQFVKSSFSNLEELEEINRHMQNESLSKISRGIKIEEQYIDLKNQNPEENEEHILVFTYPSGKKYEDICKSLGVKISNVYFIHASSIEEVQPDIDIAINNLHIKKVVFLAIEPSEYRNMFAEMKRAVLKGFMQKASVEFRKI
ncbi:MAG: carbonic anhydrase [Candidatus Micrarchaeia archaeon]